MLTKWIKRLFEGLRRVFADHDKPTKTFIVHRSDTAQSPAQHPAEGTVRQSLTHSVGGRFKVASATRPKICPQCRTREQITRADDSRFLCKACGYSWS